MKGNDFTNAITNNRQDALAVQESRRVEVWIKSSPDPNFTSANGWQYGGQFDSLPDWFGVPQPASEELLNEFFE